MFVLENEEWASFQRVDWEDDEATEKLTALFDTERDIMYVHVGEEASFSREEAQEMGQSLLKRIGNETASIIVVLELDDTEDADDFHDCLFGK